MQSATAPMPSRRGRTRLRATHPVRPSLPRTSTQHLTRLIAYYCDTADGNFCVARAAPSQRKRHNAASKPRGELTCRAPGFKSCTKNGATSCIDVKTDFNNCGECGKSCGDVEGADSVSCVAGMCEIRKSFSNAMLVMGTNREYREVPQRVQDG